MMKFLWGNHILYFIQYLPLILACVKFKFISSSRPATLKSLAPRSPRQINFVPWCLIFVVPQFRGGGLRLCIWSRHCAASRKAAGSISGYVIGTFHWLNPSGRNMALGSTHPLREMNTTDILPPSYGDCLEIVWASNSSIPKGLSMLVQG
jgi:hypothetical protein